MIVAEGLRIIEATKQAFLKTMNKSAPHLSIPFEHSNAHQRTEMGAVA